MFKILGHDRKEYGPVSAEVLRQWIAERRANAQTMVQAEGSTDYKALSQFPEFQAALAAAGPSGSPSWTITAPPPEKPASGLAVASLVLGILSFCLFITAIPAIITGHLALGRIRRQPERAGGKGMAIAGLVLGYLGLLALVPILIAGLTLPALAKAKARAQRVMCINNLKQIGLAARIYSNGHNDVFPLNFVGMSNELSSTKILICPGDRDHIVALNWENFSETENVTYEFVTPGAKESEVSQKVTFRCPVHNNVALGDGSVQGGSPGRF